jgi:hypothetical protein
VNYTLVEVPFRTELHARWSVFFDDLNVHYLYTPCTFVDRTGQSYSPAFWLPAQKVWFHAEEHRAPQWWQEFQRKVTPWRTKRTQKVDPQWRGDALLAVGPIPSPHIYDEFAGPWHTHQEPGMQVIGDACYQWTLCTVCDSFGATYFGLAERLPCRCLDREPHRKVRNGGHARLLRAYRSAHEESTIRLAASGSQVIRSAILKPGDAHPLQSRRCTGVCRSVADLMGVDSPGSPGSLEGADALCGLCPEFVCRECAQRPTDEIDGHCQVCVPRPLLSEFGARRVLNTYVTAQAGPEGTPAFEKACAFFNSDINWAMGIRSRPEAKIADLVVGLNYAHEEAASAEPGVDRAAARRKARNDAYYKKLRERSKAAKTSPLSPAQHDYLVSLTRQVGPAVFDAHLAVVIRGTNIAPRGHRELCVRVIDRLTGATANKLITRLKAHPRRPVPKPTKPAPTPTDDAL